MKRTTKDVLNSLVWRGPDRLRGTTPPVPYMHNAGDRVTGGGWVTDTGWDCNRCPEKFTSLRALNDHQYDRKTGKEKDCPKPS